MGFTPCLFPSPDFYKYKFIDCRMNATFTDLKQGCQLDFERNNDFLIYLVSFLGSLSVLPGNIISALLMDKVGRIKMIGKPFGRWIYWYVWARFHIRSESNAI